MYDDTYFLNPQEALAVATEQNRWGENNYNLQVCYYDGEIIESEFSNLIHLSLDNLVDELAQGVYRIPTKLDFTGLEISDSVKDDILANFNQSIAHAQNYREQYNFHYVQALRSMKLNFNEPLRFHIMASTSTQVMQYVAKGIVDELESSGYNVFFDLRDGAEDSTCFRRLLQFNPHVTICLNHLNNGFLGPDVFNFIWFQDPMPMLLNDEEVQLRDRDYVYSLVPAIDKLLDKKGIPYERQSFGINTNIYKKYENIKREKKIVFIGSSYAKQIPDGHLELIDYLANAFHDGVVFTEEKIHNISAEFNIDKATLESRVIPFIVRDMSVIQLCRMRSEYEIEIYGFGWDQYSDVAPYFKGPLQYGDDIAKVYNSATFAFAPHQQYVLQQRVLEASACGAIPIVYDCRDLADEPYEEALVYFKTFNDLQNILLNKNVPQKDFTRLLEENSYKSFVGKILKVIGEN